MKTIGPTAASRSRKAFYSVLYVQVLFAVAVALGRFWPSIAVDIKPLGDGFICCCRGPETALAVGGP